LGRDYGEDLLVRIFDNGQATPFAFYVQAKATDQIFKYSSDEISFSFPVKRAHIEHWARFREPVLLTLWDAQKDQTYWECIHSYLASPEGKAAFHKAGQTFRIRIPAVNTLDSFGLERISSRTRIRLREVDCEKEGARALVERFEQTTGATVIEYSPKNGVLIWRDREGATIHTIFGKTKVRLEELAQALNSSPEEASHRAIMELHDVAFGTPTSPIAEGAKMFLDLAQELVKRGCSPEDILELFHRDLPKP